MAQSARLGHGHDLTADIHQCTDVPRQVVTFQVVDTMAGDAARGDWAGRTKEVVDHCCSGRRMEQPVHGVVATGTEEK